MTQRLAAFDAWARRGPFTLRDLAISRIIFASGSLLTLFDLSWWANYPSSMFLPPVGPFSLLPGFPPAGAAFAIEIGVAICLAALAWGFHTRVASWGATILMLLGFGFSYSFGKIDHPILFIIAPAVLSFTGWGDDLSIDGLRGRRPVGFRQWPLRLFALMIGLSFFTAGFAKLRAGWLSPETQAARREFLTAYVDGNNGGILESLVGVMSPTVWEVLDWATVALELGLVVCVISWTSFRVGLALITLFHLGVVVLLAISFGFNVLCYGAFIQWRQVRLRVAPRLVAFALRGYPVLILAVGLGLWFLSHSFPHTAAQSDFIVVAGAGIAAGYLAVSVVRAIRSVRRRDRQRRAPRSAPR